jgi:phage protein D
VPQGDSLVPSFIVYLNNSRLPPEREAEIKEIVVIDKINAPSSFVIRVSDPDNEWKEKDNYYIGSKMKISLGYKDAVEELFNGEITGLSCSFKMNESAEVTLFGHNSLHKLSRFKKNMAFSEKTVKDIVSDIASGASMSADVENLSDKHLFTLQHDQSDFEYLLSIAERYDCYLSVKDTKLSFKRLVTNKAEDLTLEYGKTLLEFSPVADTSCLISEADVVAWDPAKHEAIDGKATHSDISSKGGKIVNDMFGGAVSVSIDDGKLDKNQAKQRATDIITRNNRDYVTGEGSTYGNTKIRAGSIVKAEGLGNKFSGKYFVIKAIHRLRPTKAYKTSFSFISSLGSPSQSGGDSSSQGQSTQQSAKAAAGAEQPQKKNPQFSNLKWKLDGADVTKAHVGDKVVMSSDVRDLDDGTQVKINIWEKDQVGSDDFITFLTAYVKDGKVERNWTVEYHEDTDDVDSEQEQNEKGYTMPEYVFKLETTTGPEVVSGESPVLEVKDYIEFVFRNENGVPIENAKFSLIKNDGTVVKEIKSDKNGIVRINELDIGDYGIEITKEEKSE